MSRGCGFFFFFFNDTATTEIYTLSLHDALPICTTRCCRWWRRRSDTGTWTSAWRGFRWSRSSGSHEERRSEEHTSELQSRLHLVCRLLLEKKKKTNLTWHKLQIGIKRNVRAASH